MMTLAKIILAAVGTAVILIATYLLIVAFKNYTSPMLIASCVLFVCYVFAQVYFMVSDAMEGQE